nr:hypothetical protein [Lachnospiraceae bacterium]
MKHFTETVKDIINKYSFIMTKQQKKLGVGLFFMLVIGSFLEMLSVSVVVPYMQALLAPQNLLEQKFLGPILV